MRILEYGWVRAKQVKCNHCGSILEYIPNDLICIGDLYCLRCPVCGKQILTDNYGNKFVKERCSYLND